MPKVKSKKSLQNRIKITKTGKLLRRQSFRRHLKEGKSAKRLKNLKRSVEIKGYHARKISKFLGKRKRS